MKKLKLYEAFTREGEWEDYIRNEVDDDLMNQFIVDVADSYAWNEDERWSQDYNEETDEYEYCENEQDWFDTYSYFAKNDLIDQVTTWIMNEVEREFDERIDHDKAEELAEELTDNY